MSCSIETSFTPSPTPAPDGFVVPDMAPTVLQLSVEHQRRLELVVEASYPFEACGVMIGRAETCAGATPARRRRVVVEDVFHGRNLNAERARNRFLLDPQDHLAADRVARRRGLDVVGFWHSHPDHPARPSATDLEAAWEDHSYLIVSTAAYGDNVFRSWRLNEGLFQEERIHQVEAV